jgi:hypothetical protein
MDITTTNAVAIQSVIADEKQREHVHNMLAELLITISDKYFEGKTIYVDGF